MCYLSRTTQLYFRAGYALLAKKLLVVATYRYIRILPQYWGYLGVYIYICI